MPVPDFGGLPPFPDFNDVTNKINDLVQRLKQLLLNLDTLNVRSLNAEVIIAGTITTEKLSAGSVTAEKIQANAVTAEKIDVGELSAITANLGHITAGLIESVSIFGSYIATRNGAYPRAEMSATNDLFGAYFNANEGIAIEADYGGAPSLNLIHEGNIVGRIDMLLGYPEIIGTGSIEIGSYAGGNIYLNPTGSGYVVLSGSDFSKIKSYSGGSTLQDELNTKATSGISTGFSGSANGGIAPGTVLRTADGGTVTWVGISSHTHEQI